MGASLAGCQDMTKQDMGVIGGGAIGGLLGSQFGKGSGQVLAAVGGTILGAAIGGLIGRNMDKTDQLEMQQALESQRTNTTKTWHNPDQNAVYHVTPKKTYYRRSGTPCREYYMTANIGGKKEQVYGTACRQSDGSWKIVNSRNG